MQREDRLQQLVNGSVWAIWFSMLVFALLCIYRYAPNMPLAEDWLMVPALTGNEEHMLSWLWSQNNEHRIPLPRLILLGLLTLSHGDFRVGMVFNVLSLGLLSAIALRVCVYIRGGNLSPTDAFIPIALLHIGHANNLFWSWQVGFVVPTALILGLLLLIVQYQSALKPSLVIIAGLCLLALPLCGANGLLYVLPIAPWLLYEGFLQWQQEEATTNKWLGLILISSIVLTGIEAIVYFIGYEHPYWNPPSPSIFATIRTGWQFEALGLGPAVEYQWYAAMLIIIALVLPALVLLLQAVRWSIVQRDYGLQARRAWGLLFFLLGGLFFALVMGYGRAGAVPVYGLPARYSLLAFPLILVSYFTWILYAAGRWQKPAQWVFFLLMAGLIYPNFQKGYSWLSFYNEGTRAVLADIETGMTASAIAKRNKQFLMHWDKGSLPGYIDMLKEAKMGAFKHVKPTYATN